MERTIALKKKLEYKIAKPWSLNSEEIRAKQKGTKQEEELVNP